MNVLNYVICAWLSLGSAVAARPTAATEVYGVAWAGEHHQANAVVWLDAPNAPAVHLPQKVVLDQRNLAFSPHVVAIRVGTEVEFPNNDRVFHNVFSWRDGKRFDLGMYPVGASKTATFDRPGLSRIFCNIHPNMAAYILAVDSSYFGVSDADGAFTLPPLPNGVYGYHAWRPGGSTLTGSVTLDGVHPLEIRWP
jgi:plastocyanin